MSRKDLLGLRDRALTLVGFAQLQEAGMKAAKLDEIVRQRDPELKYVVEQLARGEVRQAVASLDDQGRVHEYTGREERIAAIAEEYARPPQSTLVVSPDNRSRSEINQRVHSELQSRGLVNREEHIIRTLVPRQEMTGADRTWAQQYQVDDILRYSRSSQETGIKKGEYTRVVGVDAQRNLVTVVRADGSEQTYDPRRQMGVIAYRAQEKAFSVGDRIQFTSPNNDRFSPITPVSSLMFLPAMFRIRARLSHKSGLLNLRKTSQRLCNPS
jgi:hypothetical protein